MSAERNTGTSSGATPPPGGAPGGTSGGIAGETRSGALVDNATPADGASVDNATPAGDDAWSHFGPAVPVPPGWPRRVARRVWRLLIHEWTLASIGGVALAIVMTWPVILHPTRTIANDIYDPTLEAWMLAWSGHAMRTDPAQLWNTNAFYPDHNSFAFSDTLLGYFPAGLIGNGPVAALLRYNILFVLVFALAFVGGYALLRQLGSTRTGAVVAGAAIAYAPWRWGQAGHMHVLSVGGIALALAMLARGHGYSLVHGREADREKPGWAIAGWLVAAWQITIGFGIGLPFAYILGALFAVAAVVLAARRLTRRHRLPRPRLLVADGIGMVIFVVVGALMARPYLQVAATYPYAARSEADLKWFSPPLRGFFIAPQESLPWGDLHAAARAALTAPAEMALLPGFMLYGLAAAGLVFSVWRWRVRLWLLAGVLLSIALGMGTNFYDGGRFTYLLLYDYLPGFNGLRTPGRLVVWTTMLLAVLAAGAVSELVRRAYAVTADRVPYRPGLGLRLFLLLPVALVLLEGTNQMPVPVVPAQPAALATVSGPMLVLPSDQLTDENIMLWSTTKFQPMVNGGSGFTPNNQQRTRDVAQSFPDATSVAYLRGLGVRTVVVLTDRVAGTPYAKAATATGAGLGISRQIIGGAVVFTLDPG